MDSFLTYILSEVKNGRLLKSEALLLLRQLNSRIANDEKSHVSHPFLHQNTSDLTEQRFSTTWTGQEFFLTDHVIQGQKVLPGVACLEMARVAVAEATRAKDGAAIILKNVVWTQPIVAGEQPLRVHIRLYPEGSGEIGYEIYRDDEANPAESVVYSQGSALLSSDMDRPVLQLKTIQEECNPSSLTYEELYETFRAMGIEYGPGHQGIKKLYVGESHALAELSLPMSVRETQDQYVLHPSIMDSALQAVIGLRIGGEDRKASLPFAVQEIQIMGTCTPKMWAWVRNSRSSQAGDRVRKLDIDVCDDQGKVCIQMKEISFRGMEGELQNHSEPQVALETAMLTPVWDVITEKPSQACSFSNEQVFVIGANTGEQSRIGEYFPNAHRLEIGIDDNVEEIAKKIEMHGTADHIIWIAPYAPLGSLMEESFIEKQNQSILSLFRTVKALLKLGYGGIDLNWSVITTQAQPVHKNDHVNPIHAGIDGFIGSMAKEYTNWKIRLLDLEADCSWPIDEMFALPWDSRGNPVAYRGREWYSQKLVAIQPVNRDRTSYKKGGVYVVIGGAGGIGEIWTDYMIRTYQAQIIWIGRRPKDEAIQTKLDQLAILGVSPHYMTADATNQKELQQAYEEIKRKYTGIDGVIHSALVLHDQSLANMEEESFRAGLAAKVDISVHIAQVFHQEPLDFVMFFSSFNSFTKAFGQSNYTSGCTFADTFAHQLSLEWPCAVKVMNWGYWGSVGIVASKAYRERMEQAGIGSIEPPEAMAALETLLAGPLDQIGFIKTTKSIGFEALESMEERITIYPDRLKPNLENISNNLPKRNQELEVLKNTENLAVKEMENVLHRLLLGQLQALGLLKSGEWTSGNQTKTVLLEKYDRWLKESFTVLETNQYLRFDGAHAVVNEAPLEEIDSIWEDWFKKKNTWLEIPNLKAQVTLVEETMRALPAILTGKVLATDIMFPDSSLELVEGIYKNNLVADYFNGVLVDTIIAHIEDRLHQDPAARIRLIEIGAGTGGTSSMIFRKLEPYREHIQEYCYTDISKAFIMHAENVYGASHPYLTYQLFNVEQPAAGQGIRVGDYDIVIAANVIHATPNIRQTIRNLKAVARKNGLILLNEISRKSLFTHLTFGLLEGWWLYQDPELRIPGCPGLSSETWRKVLENEGFKSVYFPAETAHDLGLQIIAAESDGVVRQKQLSHSNAIPGKQIAKKQTEEVASDLLRDKSTSYLKRLIGETLKLPSHKIDSTEQLEKYGIDSILVTQLTNNLRKVFANVSSTLFFEYQTIDALVEHFLITQKESLIALVGLEQKGEEEKSSRIDPKDISISSTHNHSGMKQTRRFLHMDEPSMTRPESTRSAVEEIAIVGLSGRYPGAIHMYEFWNQLKAGQNCISEIPGERWNWRHYYHAEKGNKGSIYTKWGGFLEDIDKFDPLFFNIAPAEAEKMDPQERLFLETAYACIEDAGYTTANLSESRKVGVFVGVMNGNYPTGHNYWSIANRVSYLFNFHGPSIAVDSACSSSLTAIHLALESLHSGTSECAIVGGVNLIVDPVHYKRLSAKTMLSSTDQCKAFGEHADGFVAGEGVGAVVLKPLSKAIADGDQIYGVIKGTAINHGGKTNGYTVPSPNAQGHLISQALKDAGVNPRTISYLEAHGTGTVLGDPIEINGLTRAFGQDTWDKQFCAIGSVKSNIGHCEGAAGIAGLTKVLLQLKNGHIVPSLHSEVLNPNIDFKETPFVVQQELTEWKRPLIEIDGEAIEYPRRAGISSFGAGGANAHVVIEEYISKDRKTAELSVSPENPAIIILSAKDEERLLEQVRRLIAAIQEQPLAEKDVIDTAYTLQVGREAMEERLAVIVSSLKELQEKLTSFLEGKDDIEDLYRGQVKRNKETMAIFNADEDMHHTIDAWISKQKYGKLLDLWVKGLSLDWNRLYPGSKPRRISLPTYPFARERYWVPEMAAGVADIAGGLSGPTAVTVIHPLLHQNTSDLTEQRFSTTLTGQEFFLTDHVIKGQRVLPGAACLEMARAAVAEATRGNDGAAIKLKNVVWTQPVVAGEQSLRVHIGLYPADDGEIEYEIYREDESDPDESVFYSQGRALLSPMKEKPLLHLTALQEQCNQSNLSSDELYQAFRAMGIEYGPGHQGIEKVYVGEDQALAALSLPFSVLDTQDTYVLHPSIMDSALQASIGLRKGKEELKAALPFALQEIEIFGACTQKMWAWIRSSTNSQTGERVRKLDIDLCDEQGNVCIRMKGLSSRALEGEIDSPESQAVSELLMLEPVWEEQVAGHQSSAIEYAQHLIILCELSSVTSEALGDRINGAHCISLQSYQESIAERFQSYAVRIFEEIQGLVDSKPKKEILIQIIVPNQGEGELFKGLLGLLKTAQIENPKLIGQLIEVEVHEGTEGIKKILETSSAAREQHIRYQSDKRLVSRWKELEEQPKAVDLPWKDRGVYLITGGTGGLGLVFAEEIAERVQGAVVVLAGRSSLNEAKRAQLKQIENRGVHIVYRQVDVTDKHAVAAFIRSLQEQYGRVDGIIHSAGVIQDNFILNKTKDECIEVLAPKVCGLENLDLASQDLRLDFFILFSSLTGRFGNMGQADYATANAFMDAYANYRNRLVQLNRRHGKTLSVNWPLWQAGGMSVVKEREKMMMQNTGMVAMQTETGIRALYQSIASGKDQIMVMEGQLTKMRQQLLAFSPAHVASMKLDAVSTNLQDQLQQDLIQIAAELLKVNQTNIDANVALSEYGFDPFHVTELANKLNEKYAFEVSPTLLFDHSTLRHTAVYLIETYGDMLKNIYRNENLYITVSAGESTKSEAADEELLYEKVVNYVKRMLSSIIKLPANRIEADAQLEKYGIDSVMVMQLTNQLEKVFGSLSKTLFFEYQTIQQLARYFLEAHREQLQELLGIEEKVAAATNQVQDIGAGSAMTATKRHRRHRFVSLKGSPAEKDNEVVDVAIVGVSGRYPGARNLQEFWNNLRDGRDCITEIPKERWDSSLNFDEDKTNSGKTYSKRGGFLEGVDQFDPLFFHISPREAEVMDPQERLFLECVYEAVEDAGYTRDSLGSYRGWGLERNVGVYVGVMYEEYQLYGAQEQIQGRPVTAGGTLASIANRVSYFFNFHGPSMAVETMCSSSLTAIHLACQSIQRGGCELAIAGGVNISIHPNKYLKLSQGKFISNKGRCESFGEGGDGYVPGEGVGAVLLKPLSKAIADGDQIYGVIKGTAINHGGKTNGYTVPNPNAQGNLISQALKDAGVNPRTISYLEAHGTGTVLGDPIEITGLTRAFGQDTPDKQFCAIGSVKSNIGHSEGAAGIAGLTKVLLQLKNGQIVPSLHSKVLNPHIDFKETPFVVQQELTEWKRPLIEIDGKVKEYPRRAGISSFGAGGANAHVVIEEYMAEDRNRAAHAVSPDNPAMIVLSAKNEERLKEQVQRLITAIQEQPLAEKDLIDIAYTLQVGREAMEERLAVIAGSLKELQEKLTGYLEGKDDIDLYRGQSKRNKETMDVFTADEDLVKAIDAWISKRKYGKLLDLWVKGLSMDWNRLYPGNKPRRISLPTYPFARERYWLFGNVKKISNLPVTEITSSNHKEHIIDRKMCFLKKQWELCSAASTREADSVIAILITKETMGLANLIKEHFPKGQILNVHDLEPELLESQIKRNQYDGLIDLIGCGTDIDDSLNWIPFVQQFIEQGEKEGLMALCVTKGLESFYHAAINLSGASRAGLYRMLQSEYRQLRSRHVDMDPAAQDRELAQQIALEFLMESEEPEVCYRNGQRYRSYLKEYQGENQEARQLEFPEKHVLLVTGGTRGLGYLCAQHFVAQYGVKRIVLTGREQLRRELNGMQ
ncbi:SDR family NAD(P)-dependent oxidoreductase [Paenibacillus hexagrammi]|uniref:SDR family NAD(P)-dependent oxidoreductase n=1 Tax=Paenibacillus hexagrammi TaxID=2908839 RepID=A0ABY3SL23_9BACL|nr:SDR family NAD(P)-dependent oxidoreductase [Paenibacillus sp. YPD9-1]UJF34762.1 SDR family NAD(P)-dependent oxidoreductase [Paenibacillus sp. YPD9-1]